MPGRSKRYKLAIIASHIIQYHVPLYRKVNAHPEIEVTIFFCSDQGLVSRLKDKGFGVKFHWDTINLDGLNYKFLSNYSPFPKLGSFFGMINPGILRELHRRRYDALLVPGYALFSYWFAFCAALITRTPFFLSGEPPTPWRTKWRIVVMGMLKKIIMPPLLNKARGILYIGSKSKEYYLYYNKRIHKKLFFFPYSVDNDFYLHQADELRQKKIEIRKEIGIPINYPVILFLSKLISWKRPLSLLRAYRELKTPAILLYVGSGHRFKALKKYVNRHNLQRVYFFGFQNYSQVPKFYSVADIFVLPSLGESWGLAINEAMCFSLPIITTDRVMSAYDLVKDGRNGFILKTEDVESLHAALEYLVSQREACERMGKVSRTIIKDWSYDVCVQGIYNALRETVGQ